MPNDDASKPKARSPNDTRKFVGIGVGAIAVGLGSSYITVITATPSRSEVREMIGLAITAVKDTAILDRQALSEWRIAQSAAFEGLRGDVQGLQVKQAETNVLLQTVVDRLSVPKGSQGGTH